MSRQEAAGRVVVQPLDPGDGGAPGGTPQVAPSAPADPSRPGGWRVSVLGGLARTARPKQWLKNVLVFAAPAAAGVLTQAKPLADSALAFVVFCMVAAGTYFFNDAFDVEADRRHPRKRFRPVAAGVISVRMAKLAGGLLLGAGLALSAAVAWKLVAVVAIYIVVQAGYTLWLKHQPILDLAAVAAGFVLRAVAGGVAVGVPISQWFLIVATFGSLFMVTGKRSAEHSALGDDRGGHRATLDVYTPEFLRYILMLSSSVAITAYCLWAFESSKLARYAIYYQLSIVPFVLVMLRYALLIDQGHGGAPEDVMLSDRVLQVLAVIWAVAFALGVYA